MNTTHRGYEAATRQFGRRKALFPVFRILLVLSLLLLGNTAMAERQGTEMPVSLEARQFSLAEYAEHLIDPTGNLNLRDVRSMESGSAWTGVDNAATNLGFTGATHWFRFLLKNETDSAGTWMLLVSNPLLDDLQVSIIASDGRITDYATGDRWLFEQRPVRNRNFVFPIAMSPGERVDVYVRARNEGSLQVPMSLMTEHAFHLRERSEQLLLGCYYGIVIALALYNLLIFLSIRDRSYLYYVIYLVSFGLLQFTLNGLAYEYLWPNSPILANRSIPFLIAVSMMGVAQFTRTFLALSENSRPWDWFFRGLLVVFGAIAAVGWFLPFAIILQVVTAITLMTVLAIFTVAGLCFVWSVRAVRYFLLAWTLFLLGIVVYIIKTFGWLPPVFVTEYGIQIGAALEVILLSFALADRIRLLKEDKAELQREAAASLERKVAHRTRALDAALRELSLANEKLKAQSATDELTGIKNRGFFESELRAEWRRAHRARYPVALLMIDIDHFKRVNDTYGHLTGDETLKQVAKLISQSLRRPGDMVARYGGEEFAVLLPQTDWDGALHLAERTRRTIEQTPVESAQGKIPLTISVGVAVRVPEDTDGYTQLVADADECLYKAKAAGRNQVQMLET